MQPPKRTINKEIRDIVSEMRVLYTQVRSTLEDKRGTTDTSAQTSPIFKVQHGKDKRKPNGDRGRMEQPAAKKQRGTAEQDTGVTVPSNEGNAGTWNTVERKRQLPKKARAPKPKSHALIISKTGDASYSDILKKVKEDKDLREVGDCVQKIRRTAKGDMLLTFSKDSNANLG
ncbi:hypothetical protein PSTG_19033, partial [Puccinia striiformis f. sp. tritici PST-78]